LDRRKFIARSFSAVFAAGCLRTAKADAMSIEQKKFTIIGAGMAGLYAAWRLVVQSERVKPSDIWILETTNRIGGRLDTFTFPRGVTVELGGMRFNTSQKLVTQLVKDFAFECLDFPEADNRLYYLRRKHIWQREMKKICMLRMLPYHLSRAERRKTPDDLLDWAVGNAIGNPSGWKQWAPPKWHVFVEQTKYSSPSSNPVPVYKGVSYGDVGFWDLLRDQLSNEGYRYATEGGGYDSNTINWNSAIAMPYVASGDYASDMKYQRIDGGYHKLPEALCSALQNAKVQIELNAGLISFANDGSGMIDCTFRSGGVQSQFKTEHLFLCIPPRSLELLDSNTDFVTQLRQKQYLDSVIKQPSFKLLLLYKERWYQKVRIRRQFIKPFGPTITDLPLRMIWYFDPDPRKEYWALLASYCDMDSTEFWKVMEKSPAEMAEMARSQLQSVHNIEIPKAEDAVFQDWGLDPYGAGYHAWAAHYSPWNMFGCMLKPVPSYNVYICGEAYSLDQGWVEGALSTVDECLRRKLGIKPYVEREYITSLTGAVAPASASFGLRRL
jgi:monoamine oxidase